MSENSTKILYKFGSNFNDTWRILDTLADNIRYTSREGGDYWKYEWWMHVLINQHLVIIRSKGQWQGPYSAAIMSKIEQSDYTLIEFEAHGDLAYQAWEVIKTELDRYNPLCNQAAAESVQQPEGKPWDIIQDPKKRKMVELWCEGYSSREIARQFECAPKTISNRISELRQRYGPEVVLDDTSRVRKPERWH